MAVTRQKFASQAPPIRRWEQTRGVRSSGRLLRLNGRVALFDDDETYEFIIDWLSSRSRTLDSIDEWFRAA